MSRGNWGNNIPDSCDDNKPWPWPRCRRWNTDDEDSKKEKDLEEGDTQEKDLEEEDNK